MDLAQFPRRLMICGVPHAVRYADQLKGESKEEVVYGYYHAHRHLIEISLKSNDTPEMVWRSLLHEALHAILHVTGQSEGLGGETEEALVIALENGIAGLFPQLGGLGSAKQASKKQG